MMTLTRNKVTFPTKSNLISLWVRTLLSVVLLLLMTRRRWFYCFHLASLEAAIAKFADLYLRPSVFVSMSMLHSWATPKRLNISILYILLWRVYRCAGQLIVFLNISTSAVSSASMVEFIMRETIVFLLTAIYWSSSDWACQGMKQCYVASWKSPSAYLNHATYSMSKGALTCFAVFISIFQSYVSPTPFIILQVWESGNVGSVFDPTLFESLRFSNGSTCLKCKRWWTHDRLMSSWNSV